LTAPPPRPPSRRVAATLDAPPVRGGELAPAARESARGVVVEGRSLDVFSLHGARRIRRREAWLPHPPGRCVAVGDGVPPVSPPGQEQLFLASSVNFLPRESPPRRRPPRRWRHDRDARAAGCRIRRSSSSAAACGGWRHAPVTAATVPPTASTYGSRGSTNAIGGCTYCRLRTGAGRPMETGVTVAGSFASAFAVFLPATVAPPPLTRGGSAVRPRRHSRWRCRRRLSPTLPYTAELHPRGQSGRHESRVVRVLLRWHEGRQAESGAAAPLASVRLPWLLGRSHAAACLRRPPSGPTGTHSGIAAAITGGGGGMAPCMYSELPRTSPM